jgi:ElaB/YqjD/DUF883 family membrane-anchored ribosome-binding protein
MSTEETLRSATDELRQRLADLEHDLAAVAQASKAAAREKLEEARSSAAAYCDERRAKVQGLEKSLEQCVAEQPVKAVLAAAAAGFVLGALWMRR